MSYNDFKAENQNLVFSCNLSDAIISFIVTSWIEVFYNIVEFEIYFKCCIDNHTNE